MKTSAYNKIICILIIGLFSTLTARAQIAFMSGSDYTERGNSLIDHMLKVKPEGGEPKYVSPYYFARIWRDYEKEYAIRQLSDMYQKFLDDPNLFYSSGSGMDFYVHATMHGYLLTKDKLPAQLQDKIKAFMKLGKYATDNGTLNMKMMHQTSGYLSAEEWPDFIDAEGTDATELKNYLKGRILKVLTHFFLDNCPEADAFTYLVTNLQYVRMLAEFAREPEIQKTALSAYQHMIAQMLLSWNKGLYCANPPRCKGWRNLYTSNLSTDVQIVQTAWLYYGAPNERIIRMEAKDKDNFGCFHFWLAYQRTILPLPLLQELNKSKTYPYSFNALRVDNKHYYSRYTYQSENYGLSTQTVEAFPDKLKDFQYTYAFKETKNIHLVWQSDWSEAAIFSVCMDNPERPQQYQTKSNKLGYGENPYHRVYGYEKTAIGIYNVANDYMELPIFYQMYVPFSREGIKERMVKKINGLRWVLCHTGSMMFAFTTPEKWEFDEAREKYYDWGVTGTEKRQTSSKGLASSPRIKVSETVAKKNSSKGHDVLILKDKKRRKGSWILETSEITPQYKSVKGNLKTELKSFANAIRQKTRFTRSDDYEVSPTPNISYTNLDGNTLELTFFSPEAAYNGNYKLNGIPVQLNTEYISKSSYMEQKANSGIVLFHTLRGEQILKME